MTISAFPTTPSRASSPEVFEAQVDDFLSHFPTFVTDVNAESGAIASNKTAAETAATTATTKASEASTSATNAATSATSASNSASTATTKASEASASASSAATSAASASSSATAAANTPVAAPTHAATSKATPVDADELPLADSADSFGLKKLTWANLKAGVKTSIESGGLNLSGSLGLGVSAIAKLHAAVASSAPSAISAGVRIYETTGNYGLNLGATGTYGWIQGLRGASSTDGYNDLVMQPNSGSLGLGVAPDTISGGGRMLNVGFSGAGILAYSNNDLWLTKGAYYNAGWKLSYASVPAVAINLGADSCVWYNSPAGTVGATATGFGSSLMSLNGSGTFTVGSYPTTYHTITKQGMSEAQPVLGVSSNLAGIFSVQSMNANGQSGTATGLYIGKNSSTSRSINAAGTINASGADYAEYEKRAATCQVIAKGAIVGFDASGLLTLTFADAVRFGIKSTAPSYVGGDTWGSEEAVGPRPAEPYYERPKFDGAPHPGQEPVPPVLDLPEPPVRQEGESDESFEVRGAQWQQYVAWTEREHAAAVEAFDAALLAYQTALAQHRIDELAYAVLVAQAEQHHAAMVELYRQQLAVWEARLESERQKVDRIAYSGKVPCNVTGAVPGGYIIAAAGAGGEIIGQFVSDPTFTQYKRAVGRVNRILEDGRCEVAVIVH